MTVSHIVILFVALLGMAAIAEPLARFIRLPYSSVLVLLGFCAGQLIEFSEVQTGLQAENFQELVFYVFIPALIFESAYQLDLRLLRENIGNILLLAIVGLLLTTCITAVGMYYGIAHASGFPWIAALLTGALLAATDPVAVVSQLRAVGAPPRLAMLLEGESLFNDATAIVLFTLLLTLATASGAQVSAGASVLQFGYVFIGGIVVGGIVGALSLPAFRVVNGHSTHYILTLVAAYGAFILAEHWLEVSGVMAVLMAGLIAARSSMNINTAEDHQRVAENWETLGHIANALIFLLLGITITIAMFEERWLAMLIGIAAVFFARALSIFAVLFLSNLFSKNTVPAAYQTVMVWGGLRGAVTLALALSLPTELPYWWTIQSVAFGVVLFTLFLQAPTTPWLLRRLKLNT
ncbi:MAG: cation:proton antiporter [Pseudomonadales bacterium]